MCDEVCGEEVGTIRWTSPIVLPHTHTTEFGSLFRSFAVWVYTVNAVTIVSSGVACGDDNRPTGTQSRVVTLLDGDGECEGEDEDAVERVWYVHSHTRRDPSTT